MIRRRAGGDRRRSGGLLRAELPMPKRPYRDSVVFYAVLSVCLVFVALLTGGDLARALVVGAGFFVFATAWSWWRFRARIASERRAGQR